MISEQIRKEIAEQVDKKLMQNSIENIVLNSRYMLLTWNGVADRSNLAPSFNLAIIQNRLMLIKSIKQIMYAGEEIDELWNDTTSEHFTIPASARIQKLEDRFARGNRLEIFINGTDQNIFPENIAAGAQFGIQPDIFVDNIYYNYKSIIENILVRSDIQVIDDLNTGALAVNSPFVRVQMEVYLY